MSFMQEFKSFAVKGNVVDLAVGVIIGGAFGKIVTSVVNDIVMPPIGLIIGGINFKDLKVPLSYHPDGSAAATFAYGSFIQTIIEFIIIALAVFVMVKALNKLKKKEAEKPSSPLNPEVALLTEIRDLLKK
jgi:large conductance mechanosensitive channel